MIDPYKKMCVIGVLSPRNEGWGSRVGFPCRGSPKRSLVALGVPV